MLLDMIRSHAALMQFQREHQEHNGISCIIATEEDFQAACDLFIKLNGQDGGQMSKLTRNESELINAIVSSGMTEIKVSDLQKMTGKSNSAIYKMLGGYRNRNGAQFCGILEKCPALSYLDRTDLSEGGGVSRRVKVYVWDHDVYNRWSSAGGCWLEGDINSTSESDSHDDDGDDDLPGSGSLEALNRLSEAASFRYENEAEESDLKNNNNINNKILVSSNRKLNPGSQNIQQAPSHTSEFSKASTNSCQDHSEQPSDFVLRSEEGLVGVPELPIKENKEEKLPLTSRLKAKDLDPDRFHKVDGIWKGPCAVCGRKWVQYEENCHHRKERKGPNLLVCQKCMDKAVSRKILSFRTIPGTVRLPELKKVSKSIGKCDICGTANATWSGPGIRICSLCYEREAAAGGGAVCRL